MIFQQILNEESGCLSYLIGCGEAGKALVVDPGRDRVPEYLRLAAKKGLTISHILETHTHADHISGNRDLAEAVRAPILVHRAAGVAFEHQEVSDGDELQIGTVRFKIAHTPGHTPDRPDLGGARAAEDAWESLQRVLLPLDDSVEVYPAHGAGSACGKAMSAKSGSTIGFERRFNPALQLRDRQAFVDFLMKDLPPKPPSFEKIVGKNKGLISLAVAKPRPFTAREAWEAVQRGDIVLDLRDPGTYGEMHVAGAVNVWIESPQFAERVAGMVPAGAALLLLAQGPSDLDRAVQALARVGVDEISGFLQWGMIEWRSEGFPVETVPQITVSELAEWLEQGRDVAVIDVREHSEWIDGHIDGAIHLPMLEAAARRAEGGALRRRAPLEHGDQRPQAPRSARLVQRHRRHDGVEAIWLPRRALLIGLERLSSRVTV